MNDNIIDMLIDSLTLDELYKNYSHEELCLILPNVYPVDGGSIECVTTFLVNYFISDYEGIEITVNNIEEDEKLIDEDFAVFEKHITDCVMYDIHNNDSISGMLNVQSSYNHVYDMFTVKILDCEYTCRYRLDAINACFDMIEASIDRYRQLIK